MDTFFHNSIDSFLNRHTGAFVQYDIGEDGETATIQYNANWDVLRSDTDYNVKIQALEQNWH